MSLIDDAMKAAQRERSRLDAGAGRPVAPVFVRLRAQPRAPFSRTHVIGAASVAGFVAVAALLWVQVTRDDALPAVPPVTSTILTDALADTSPVSNRPTVQLAARADTAPARSAPPQRAIAPRQAPGRDRSSGSIDAAPPARETRPVNVAVQQATAASAQREPSVARVRSGALDIAIESPRNADAARLFGEAVAAHRSGAIDIARPLYERVLALAPNDADALNNLGVILSGQREFDRALELLRRAVAAAPRSAGAWNNIGAVLREQEKSTDAISAFRQALAIDPTHLGARVGLAQQFLATNAPAMARDLLLEVLKAHPALPEAHYTLGQAHEQLGDKAAAVAAYSTFIRVAPARLVAHVELVRNRIELLAGGL